ncbi:MAG: hypothetical protein ACRCZI_10355 [Cetobacterium sp.]
MERSLQASPATGTTVPSTLGSSVAVEDNRRRYGMNDECLHFGISSPTMIEGQNNPR